METSFLVVEKIRAQLSLRSFWGSTPEGKNACLARKQPHPPGPAATPTWPSWKAGEDSVYPFRPFLSVGRSKR